MTITNFEEIIQMILEREEQLEVFYEQIQNKLTNAKSRDIIDALEKEQQRALSVVRGINLKEYAHSEYIKNSPDFKNEAVIAPVEIADQSSPSEIFEKILGYEEQLLRFYTIVGNLLVYNKARELMDMLIQSKFGQIKKIRSFMDSSELSI